MRNIICAALLSLAACAAPGANTIADQYGRQVTIVDTGIDAAGGERLVTIGQFDRLGTYHVDAAAHGPGTAQTLLPSAITAAGFVGGMAVLRPPEVNTSVSQAGGSASIAPGAAVATGGAGGAGGAAMSAGGAGGAASAFAAPTASATGGAAIATNRATARQSTTSSAVGFVDP